MLKTIPLPGASPALHGEQLFPFSPQSYNNIHQTTRILPITLGKAIEQDFYAGAFKSFGEKNQNKAKEAVVWLLASIYNKTVARDKPVIQLNAVAMRQRYGKTKAINWDSLSKFCIRMGYMKRNDKYCPQEMNMSYWINPAYLRGLTDFYFPIKEKVIINKIEKEKKRYSQEQVKHEQSAEFLNRAQSVRITNENLQRLGFDYKNLDELCRNMLFVDLSTIKEWLKEVKEGAFFAFPDPIWGSFLGGYIIRDMLGRYEEEKKKEEERRREEGKNNTHSVAPFLEETENKNSQPSENNPHPFGNSSVLPASNEGSLPESVKALLRDELCRDTEIGDTVKVSSTYNGKVKPRKKTQEEKDMMRRKQVLASLVALHLDMNEKHVFTDSAGGRLYSPLVPLKREVRPALRYRDNKNTLEYIVSFDIKSSQPWFLGIAVLSYYKEQGLEVPQNVYDYLELVEKQDIYYAILSFGGKELTTENRDKVKKAVMLDLFRSKYINPNKSNKKSNKPFTMAGEFLKERFPVIWQWVLQNKGLEKKSKVPVMMQKAEADYFIGKVIPELYAMGIWCLTIHDSVIVREKDAERVRKYLDTSILDCFGRKPDIKPEVYGK